MEFNNIWTKEKNDLLRQMIKEHKTPMEITIFFGDELKSHPNRKYSGCIAVLDYNNFLKQFEKITITPKEINYTEKIKRNIDFPYKFDHIIHFTLPDKTGNIDYVLIFFYYPVNNIETYNIVFTTLTQYEIYCDGLKQRLPFNLLKNILEAETQLDNIIPLMKALSYIIFDFSSNLPFKIFSIGETKNKTKIKLYRNIIQNSFKGIKETIQIFNNETFYIYC